MRTLSLTTDSVAEHNWTLRAASQPPTEWSDLADDAIPARVPGEVHTDLLAAGRIPDPFDGDNETLLQWIGRTDWTYSLTFDWQPGTEARHDLVAEGLDTFATITLNGVEVARTANQHRNYRFDVGAVLRPGRNELVIDFAAPATAAEEAEAEIGALPVSYAHPYNAVRKMASSYGWDWGPDLAGAGIWKPIRIESWDTVRLASVRPLATVEDGTGVLQVEAELEWESDSALRQGQGSVANQAQGAVVLATEVAGQLVSAEVSAGVPTAALRVEVPEVELWWPRGYGEQPLYPVAVRLSAGDRVIDRFDARVGFRNTEIKITPDARGAGFAIRVNDQPIYIKGYNWIPDDAFLTRLDADRYRTSIMEAYESGANLLRVWGGGIYESNYFYNVCDELGILVWQDFLFACAAYSESEPLWSEVEAEARQAITRLSAHPSLSVWNGNNENIWGYIAWGWRPHLIGKTWGNGYYRDLLPKLVEQLDPRTSYSAASPYSFTDYLHPNDPCNGTMHIWDVWNQVDYSHYADYQPRFVSEFGFQGPAAWSTLTSVVHDQPLDPYGHQMLVHQKAGDGNLKLERGLGDHLPAVASERWDTEPVAAIDDWHWLTQLNQARAVRFGIEHFRSLAGGRDGLDHEGRVNSGAVVWQLNDNWPVISWAAVDYAGIRKPLWYALRSVFADRLLTIQGANLIAHNDSAGSWTGTLVITRRSTAEGSPVLAEQRVALEVAPRAALTIPLDSAVVSSNSPNSEFIQARIGDEVAYGYFAEDTALSLQAPGKAYRTTVARSADGYQVTVTANALVKDLAIFPDRLDPAARVDSGLITLVAGDSHTFTITNAEDLDEQQLTVRPVLRSVNDSVAS